MYSHRPVCVRHSSAGCIPNLDIPACWRRRDAMDVQVEMDHRQHRPPSQSSNEVLYSGTSPLPIQILSKSSSRHWIRYGECPRFILRWNFGAHPWRSLVRVYALAVDLPWSNGHKCPHTVRHSNDAQTLFTQRPYELRKVKDIWFPTRHIINNWLKNMFG